VQPAPRSWRYIIGGVLAWAALASFLAAMSFYFVPHLAPDPEHGRTYFLNNHGTRVYLTRTEYLTHGGLQLLAVALFMVAAGLDALDKKR